MLTDYITAHSAFHKWCGVKNTMENLPNSKAQMEKQLKPKVCQSLGLVPICKPRVIIPTADVQGWRAKIVMLVNAAN